MDCIYIHTPINFPVSRYVLNKISNYLPSRGINSQIYYLSIIVIYWTIGTYKLRIEEKNIELN